MPQQAQAQALRVHIKVDGERANGKTATLDLLIRTLLERGFVVESSSAVRDTEIATMVKKC